MAPDDILIPHVYSPDEIAAVAGVDKADAVALLTSGAIDTVDGRLVAESEAVRAVRALRSGGAVRPQPHALFRPRAAAARHPGGAAVATGAAHVVLLAGITLLTLGRPSAHVELLRPAEPARMVFLVEPGPGGGGGGGGLRQAPVVRKAMVQSPRPARSPVPIERAVRRPEARPEPAPVAPPAPVPVPPEPSPPAAKPDPVPPVEAPVVSASADPREQAGVIDDRAPAEASQGRGTGGGAGAGAGTGLGEGDGNGVGPGSGGGTGGGPYRPGSGVTAPSIAHEVKPDYTDEARRRSLTGDVLLEIIVARDGSVGSVRVLQGLGAGLDERAVAAVRQWRFNPARRQGTPVDVVVEVAVEFRLR